MIRTTQTSSNSLQFVIFLKKEREKKNTENHETYKKLTRNSQCHQLLILNCAIQFKREQTSSNRPLQGRSRSSLRPTRNHSRNTPGEEYESRKGQARIGQNGSIDQIDDSTATSRSSFQRIGFVSAASCSHVPVDRSDWPCFRADGDSKLIRSRLGLDQ